MKINWNYPSTIWVGENRINDLSEACKNLDINNPLFVTDKDLVNLYLLLLVNFLYHQIRRENNYPILKDQ